MLLSPPVSIGVCGSACRQNKTKQRDGTNEMAHALPPSVKFQSCCTKSEFHAILDGIWISEYQNTVSCMKHAVRTVQKSKWKLYSFDERATWQSRKDVADADAAKKGHGGVC